MPKQTPLTQEKELEMVTTQVLRKLEEIKTVMETYQKNHPEESKEVSFYALSRLGDSQIVESMQGTSFTLGLCGFSLAEHHKEERTKPALDHILKGYNARQIALNKIIEDSGIGNMLDGLIGSRNESDS